MLFPAGLLKAQIDKPRIFNCGQCSSWSNPSLARLALRRHKHSGACGAITDHNHPQTAEAANSEGGLICDRRQAKHWLEKEEKERIQK